MVVLVVVGGGGKGCFWSLLYGVGFVGVVGCYLFLLVLAFVSLVLVLYDDGAGLVV